MGRLVAFGEPVVVMLMAGESSAGSMAALSPCGQGGDEHTTIVYEPRTGELGVDAPAGRELTSINIDSAAGIFTGDPLGNLGAASTTIPTTTSSRRRSAAASVR